MKFLNIVFNNDSYYSFLAEIIYTENIWTFDVFLIIISK